MKSKLVKTTRKKKVSYEVQLQKCLNPKSPRDRQIQVTWVNTQGAECKRIIQPNRCFCTHSYQCHQNSKTIGNAFCLAPGCKCKCFQYVPYYDIKCMCRHSYKDHDRHSKMCKMCNKCLGFTTNWSCKCGFRYDQHETVFQLVDVKKINSSRTHLTNVKQDKQNSVNVSRVQVGLPLTHEELSFSRSVALDARSLEMSRFQNNVSQLHLNYNSKGDQKALQYRRQQIQRINNKYSNISFEKHVKLEQCDLQGCKIYRPEQARIVTPLELYIRPHNYMPVQLQKFLENQYKKYENLR